MARTDYYHVDDAPAANSIVPVICAYAPEVARRAMPAGIALGEPGEAQRYRLRFVPDHLGEKAPLRMQWYRGVYEKYQD